MSLILFDGCDEPVAVPDFAYTLDEPPDHPNCLCIPWIEDDDDEPDDGETLRHFIIIVRRRVRQ